MVAKVPVTGASVRGEPVALCALTGTNPLAVQESDRREFGVELEVGERIQNGSFVEQVGIAYNEPAIADRGPIT
jgi:hypothetical protein